MRSTRRTILLKLAASAIPLAAGLSHIMKKAADYSVAKGDTLSGIAKRHGTTWQNLAQLNGITNPGKLALGQRLKVPAAPWVPSPVQPVTVRKTPPTSAASAPVTAPAPVPRAAFPGRRNNPGNMRFYNVGWQGENPTGLRQGDFTQFRTPQDGVRAMIRNLRTIAKRNGTTLDKIVPVYSPKSENNTARHIQNIATLSGLRRNQTIDFNNDSQVARLARGLIQAESGKSVANWFTPQEILDAVRRSRKSV